MIGTVIVMALGRLAKLSVVGIRSVEEGQSWGKNGKVGDCRGVVAIVVVGTVILMVWGRLAKLSVVGKRIVRDGLSVRGRTERLVIVGV